MKDIIIHYPNGNCTLEEIQTDVINIRERFHPEDYYFTALTVQALIDKINEQAALLEEVRNILKITETTMKRAVNCFGT